VNALVHLPSGLELRTGIRTPDGAEHWDVRWRQLDRIGPYVAGASGEGAFTFTIGEARFLWQYAFTDGMVRASLTAENAAAEACAPLARLDFPWAPHGYAPRADLLAPRVENLSGWGADWADEKGGIGFALATRKGPSGVSLLTDDLDEALWRGVAWNTIWEPSVKCLMTPVSREWCRDENNFGDYILFPWDTFFCSLLAARRDKDLAYDTVRSLLPEVTDRGLFPNLGAGAGTSRDRSNPPVGAYCVWKLYETFDEKSFLEEVYPALKRWHEWWFTARDGNGDGLLEWGSDPIENTGPAWWVPHVQQAAKWESGMDNSPMYDGIRFNESGNTLELADVALNSMYAQDAASLADIAEALGRSDEAAAFRAEFAVMKARINDRLWDEENGIYDNRRWDGEFVGRYSPTCYYPLYAGVATPERAERSVREHLLNPEELWGEWVIPAISRKDPEFKIQKYMRGRIWPPMSYLVYVGLRRSGFHDAADELAQKSQALFLNEWRAKGHIHENYNAITGDGDDVHPDDPEGASDPIYTWGGLLALIALDSRERTAPG
jgi:hypothetical protein